MYCIETLYKNKSKIMTLGEVEVVFDQYKKFILWNIPC